ncbi:MAG: GNAT family N-acetyltransferase [Pseudomonadota bacterium]
MGKHAPSARYARPSEAGELNEFARRLFIDTYAHQNEAANMAAYIDEHFDGSAIAANIVSRAHGVIVLVDGAKFAGYAIVAASRNDSAELELEIQRFYVDGSWRGKGAASILMHAVIEHARAVDATAVVLGVYKENPRAIRYYEKSGFRIVGEHVFQLGDDPQEDWIMRRDGPELAPLTDDEFVERFLACRWPPAAWTHRAHVRLAWTLLEQRAFPDAMQTVRSGILRYNTNVLEKASAYHETVTQGFVWLVAAARRDSESFVEFVGRAADLLATDPLLLNRFYSNELLNSERARRDFVPPDRESLPIVAGLPNLATLAGRPGDYVHGQSNQ